MIAVKDFLLCIISDFWATLSTLLTVAAIIAIATHNTGQIPTSLLWAIGYVSMFVAAGRIWYKEYRQPGPKIDLDYVRVQDRDDELILSNSGPEDAFNAPVLNIERQPDGFVSFERTKVRAHDKATVKAMVHRARGGSAIFRARLADFILKTADAPSLEAALDGTVVLISVNYQNIHGQQYQSQFKTTFFPNNQVTVDLISYRRVYRPFPLIRRLSRHGRSS